MKTKQASKIATKHNCAVIEGPRVDGKHYKTKVEYGGPATDTRQPGDTVSLITSKTPKASTPAMYFENDLKKWLRGTLNYNS